MVSLCHLAVGIEHRPSWVIKTLDYDFTKANDETRPQQSKLDELRVEPYKSASSYKESVKLFHDKHILREEFASGMKVLLYDSKFFLFQVKLRS